MPSRGLESPPRPGTKPLGPTELDQLGRCQSPVLPQHARMHQGARACPAGARPAGSRSQPCPTPGVRKGRKPGLEGVRIRTRDTRTSTLPCLWPGQEVAAGNLALAKVQTPAPRGGLEHVGRTPEPATGKRRLSLSASVFSGPGPVASPDQSSSQRAPGDQACLASAWKWSSVTCRAIPVWAKGTKPRSHLGGPVPTVLPQKQPPLRPPRWAHMPAFTSHSDTRPARSSTCRSLGAVLPHSLCLLHGWAQEEPPYQ